MIDTFFEKCSPFVWDKILPETHLLFAEYGYIFIFDRPKLLYKMKKVMVYIFRYWIQHHKYISDI